MNDQIERVAKIRDIIRSSFPQCDMVERGAPCRSCDQLASVAAMAVLEALAGELLDAERYRWLRMNFGIAIPDDDGSVIWYPDAIDEAIDAARQEGL